MRTLAIITTLLTALCLRGQEMTPGFKMLEEGDFAGAESFFKEILKDYPDNPTANLCFGRATGLNGHPDDAIELFKKLLQPNPDNMEVLLNLAEAFLWKKDPSSAIQWYIDILKEDSASFAANLGLANSYSMNSEYFKAYDQINTTIDLHPDQAQAKVSKKYITLGLANKLCSELNLYDSALNLLALNLAVDPDDQESLGLKATVHLVAGEFDKSLAIYQKTENPINSLKGVSVALNLLGDKEEALATAEKALNMAVKTDTGRVLELQVHYISALLWNNKIPEAQAFLDSIQQTKNGGSPEFVASQAEISMYHADFLKGINNYADYLVHEPKSFKGNLGRADALHALGLDVEAYGQAFRAASFFPGQKDVNNFINKLNFQHAPHVETGYRYTKTSDNNVTKSYRAEASMSISPIFNSKVYYEKRDYYKQSSISTSVKETFRVSNSRQLTPKTKVTFDYTIFKLFYAETQVNQRIQTYDLSFDIWMNKSQRLGLRYFNEVQDFNEDLLKKEIKTHHLVVKNSFFWKLMNLGWYSELYLSAFSDGNKRALLYTSLYKNLLSKPALKSGINYLTMSFQENKPTDYYSPNSYNQFEAFSELNAKTKPMVLTWLIAGGYQIADGNNQPNWRTNFSVSKTTGPWSFKVSAGYSSIVTTQFVGFSFTSIEGSVKLRLSSKPVFYKKISVH